MSDLENKFNEIRSFFSERANPEIVKKYSKYFREGYDAWGIDQKTFEDQRDKWLNAWRDQLSIDDFLQLGDLLIATGKYEEGSCAILFVEAHKEKLQARHIDHLGSWLEKYILNWAHTDILCGRVLSVFLQNRIIDQQYFIAWTTSASKWQRRAVPVTFIEILDQEYSLDDMFEIIDPIMTDKEDMVQKGLGWFLREAWKRQPDPIEDFLMKWKNTCGRIIVQYATEKMDKEYRKRFRREKQK
ncbi:hypothetical protein ES705_32615 [subsurface metagenome]